MFVLKKWAPTDGDAVTAHVLDSNFKTMDLVKMLLDKGVEANDFIKLMEEIQLGRSPRLSSSVSVDRYSKPTVRLSAFWTTSNNAKMIRQDMMPNMAIIACTYETLSEADKSKLNWPTDQSFSVANEPCPSKWVVFKINSRPGRDCSKAVKEKEMTNYIAASIKVQQDTQYPECFDSKTILPSPIKTTGSTVTPCNSIKIIPNSLTKIDLPQTSASNVIDVNNKAGDF